MSSRQKTNKAKRGSRGCKNHGSCDWCKGNRTHSTKKRKPAEEYLSNDSSDVYEKMQGLPRY